MKPTSKTPANQAQPSPGVQADDGADAFIAHSLALYGKGQVRQALELVARGVALHPKSAVLLCHCGAYCALLGRADVALSSYLQAIALEPHYADAHYNLGLLYMNQQRHQEALAAYLQAIALKPDHADAYFNLGLLHKAQGRLQEAHDAYVQLIALRPGDADAHVNLGNLLVELDRPHEAETAYLHAIAAHPGHAQAHANLGALLVKLGNVLREQQRPLEAEAAYRKAIQIQPEYALAHSNLGALLMQQGQHAQAQQACLRALAIQPNHAPTHSNLGNVHKALGHTQEAEAAYRAAIALEPNYADAHYNLGLLLREQKRVEESEQAFRTAIALQPAFADAHSNLGVLLMEQRRAQEAEAAYRHALAVQPEAAHVHSNLGALLTAQGRAQEAEAAFLRALFLNPNSADASWNYSLLLLRQGRLAQGWPAYEARYWPHNTITSLGTRRLQANDPLWAQQWHGEPLQGKTLLVWPEQGFGDEIQFVRYLPLLRAQGLKKLTLVCKQPLADLFAAQGFADEVIGIRTQDWVAQVPQEYDYWCYLLSLPLHFETTLQTIPAAIPYLLAPPSRAAQWAARLPQAGVRVGLVWNGDAKHSNDAARSLHALQVLAPLWAVAGITFVSLQKGRGAEQAAVPPHGQPLVHVGHAMADFADTAAILSQLDLLITVDTSTAHLAAAMGVPCWVMLPYYCSDWRWLQERTESPWYPGTLRLFRQAADEDWSGVVVQVQQALQDYTRRSKT